MANNPQIQGPRSAEQEAGREAFAWLFFGFNGRIGREAYWLAIGLITLFGIYGVLQSLGLMAVSPFVGFIMLLSSIASVVVGVVFCRIAAEFILIVFRINEHLGAIRNQGQQF